MGSETPLYEAVKEEQGYDPAAFSLASHAEFMSSHQGSPKKPRGKKKASR